MMLFLQVTVHKQGIPPPESEALFLPPGAEVQITLSQTEVSIDIVLYVIV